MEVAPRASRRQREVGQRLGEIPGGSTSTGKYAVSSLPGR
jgi:hypothetical protein